MKGLLLNYEYGMWDATLSRKKTNTRRSGESLAAINENPGDWKISHEKREKDGTVWFCLVNNGWHKIVKPRYHPDEIIYLQEPTMLLTDRSRPVILYRYNDHEGKSDEREFDLLVKKGFQQGKKWENKMFMPRDRARYYVKITRVHLEQIQSISEVDAIAEGVYKHHLSPVIRGLYKIYSNPQIEIEKHRTAFASPITSYKSLWESINKKDGKENWNKNIWVFSYHFELVENPELIKNHK